MLRMARGRLSRVTAPSSPGHGRALRSPLPLLLIPAALIVAAAALTPANEFSRNQGDVQLYFDNARAILDGRTPYSEVPLEYPPLALVPMLAPYVLAPGGPPSFEQYRWLFAAWEAALVLVIGFVLVRIARRGGVGTRGRDPAWTVVWRLPLVVAGAALAIAWRFDVFAALLLALALWATLANRPITAGVVLGLGVLAKLFPIVAAPALAIAWLAPRSGGRFIRFGLATALTVVVGLLPFVVMAGSHALSFVDYQAARGLEIESTGAGLVLLDGVVRRQPVETASPFKAVEVFGPLAQAWLRLLPAVTVAGFAAVAVAGWRRVRADVAAIGTVRADSVVALVAASVLILVVTSKVFSIQYVVWLLPFVALLPRWQFWLGAAALALTMPIHPFLFSGLVAQELPAVLILNARNALLLGLTVAVLVALPRAPDATRRELR
jgi:hypothetical protein